MPTQTTITAAESKPPVEAGEYAAIIQDITAETGQFGAQFKFIFRLDGMEKDDGTPIEQWAWASQTLTPLSKLFKWVSAVTGQMPQLGDTYNVDDLIGSPCRVFINHEDTPTGPKAKIVDVLGPKKGAAGKPNLASRLIADPPQGATVTDAKGICAVETCGGEVEKFTARGTPLCKSHTADDL